MNRHVVALMLVESLRAPAMIPPKIPPTSKNVETSALVDALNVAETNQKIKVLLVTVKMAHGTTVLSISS